jgi:hypothetical protein
MLKGLLLQSCQNTDEELKLKSLPLIASKSLNLNPDNCIIFIT